MTSPRPLAVAYHSIHYSIMVNITWPHFYQSMKHIILGHMTIQFSMQLASHFCVTSWYSNDGCNQLSDTSWQHGNTFTQEKRLHKMFADRKCTIHVIVWSKTYCGTWWDCREPRLPSAEPLVSHGNSTGEELAQMTCWIKHKYQYIKISILFDLHC